MLQEGTIGSTRRYYHFDGLGSTSLLTDTNGDWTDKYSYDGWSNLLQHSKAKGSICLVIGAVLYAIFHRRRWV